MSFNKVEDIRAWQASYALKLAVYELIRTTAIQRDFALRDQIRESAASTVSQIEEGFAGFYPKDFGRLAVGAKASLAETRGHLRDAVDSGHITEDTRSTFDAIAAEAHKELVGLIDYLQSPEAEENARRIKAERIKLRQQRRAAQKTRTPNRESRSPEPRTQNQNPEPEPRTKHREPEH